MYNNYNDEYLQHYGVKGMKWGHRKRQAFSVAATRHRLAAKVYDINENYYNKRSAKNSKVMASMNRNAKNQALKKAEEAQAAADAKRAQRQAKKTERGKANADKILAKNTKVKDAISFKAAGHKAYAKMFEINENYYSKNNRNNQMASMNRAAKNQQLRKAEEAQAAANKRRYG